MSEIRSSSLHITILLWSFDSVHLVVWFFWYLYPYYQRLNNSISHSRNFTIDYIWLHVVHRSNNAAILVTEKFYDTTINSRPGHYSLLFLDPAPPFYFYTCSARVWWHAHIKSVQGGGVYVGHDAIIVNYLNQSFVWPE